MLLEARCIAANCVFVLINVFNDFRNSVLLTINLRWFESFGDVPTFKINYTVATDVNNDHND